MNYSMYETFLLPNGKMLDIKNPTKEALPPESIARILSRKVRFFSLLEEPYTVAQHCIIMSNLLAPLGFQYEGLMHELDETFINDIPSPIKPYCLENWGSFKDDIRNYEMVLALEYECDYSKLHCALLKAYDKCLAGMEAKQFIGEDILKNDIRWNYIKYIKNHYFEEFHITVLSPSAAEKAWLETYYDIVNERKK